MRPIPDHLPAELVDAYRFAESNPRAYDWIFGEARAIRRGEKEVAGILPAPFPGPLRVLSAGQVAAARGLSDDQTRAIARWLDRDLARSSPLGQVEVVAGAGHMIHLDRPESVVAAITEVLEAVRVLER